jgi:hypothetical protein
VLVEWVRTERATTTVPVQLSDDEVLLAQVEPVVEQWLVDNDDGSDYELGRILLEGGVLRIDVAGAGAPPSVEELVDRIRSELDTELTVRVNWTERERITPGASTTNPIQTIEHSMSFIVDRWAVGAGVIVESMSYDGQRVEIVVGGTAEPDIHGLVVELEETAGFEVPVEVFFIQRQLVTTTTSEIDAAGNLGFANPELTASTTAPSATTTTTTNG